VGSTIAANGFDSSKVARLQMLDWIARNVDTDGELAERLKV
jgi:hypothetical protein